jgi:hypothetical protein
MNALKALLLQLLRVVLHLIFSVPGRKCISKKDKMAQIARDAFNSRNFRLAAEMFEKCVKETSSTDSKNSLELKFGYADSLANCGQLREAVVVYQCIYQRECAPERLRHLAAALISTVHADGPSPGAAAAVLDPLACVVCGGVLKQPVSWNCGHCACTPCDLKHPKDSHCPRFVLFCDNLNYFSFFFLFF